MNQKEKKSTSALSELHQAEVLQFIRAKYGLDGNLERRPGYEDQTFQLTLADARYIVKIANDDEPFSVLEAQNQMMQHLAAEGIRCPHVYASKQNLEVERFKSASGASRFMRILSYLPGTFLSDVSNQEPALLQDFGGFVGRMDRALESFSHPAARRSLAWDIAQAGQFDRPATHISDSRRRAAVEYFFMQFATLVQPHLRQLRASIIHNDANDRNVLLSRNGSGFTVDGIIDFGDMVFTSRICELAIAMAYVMADKPDPLAAGCHVVRGYHRENPCLDSEIEVLFYLICVRLSISLLMAAEQRALNPENVYATCDEERIWHLLQALLATSPEAARRRFREACGFTSSSRNTGLSKNEILELRARHIGKSLSVSYDKPLQITRGAFQYLFDRDGKSYLDCVNNVSHVGHCHPQVVRAAQKQLALLNTNTRYLHSYLVEYAARLTATLPDPLSVCFFVNSGSEANDLALRLARAHTGAKDFIVLDGAYHGNLSSLIEISPYKFRGPGGTKPPPHVHVVPVPDSYRGRSELTGKEIGPHGAQELQRTLARIAMGRRQVAAFIAESLPGCAGQIVLPQGYLAAVYEHLRSVGGVCIADEVQVGFGRTGTHFWGFETQAVVPDIVTMGKPIGNGHPLGAVVTTPEIATSFNSGMEYFNTFGGNPVSCRIGLAVLDVIERECLQENAQTVGQHLLGSLRQLKQKHAIIGDVRGLGLFIGIELVADRETMTPAASQAKGVVETMKERGILISTDGPLHNVLKIKPPMVFSRANADTLLSTLDEVLENIQGGHTTEGRHDLVL